LPGWQELRAELHPSGLEIVTVALDTGGAEAASRWIEAAQPEHPALIDQAHICDELFGITNVPMGVWIDEEGIIVRPPEPAWPKRQERPRRELPPDAPPRLFALRDVVSRLLIDPETYVAALRDWVVNGPSSRFALAPEDVIERSQPRGLEEATAAAHFELGQHLHRSGRIDDAVRHFREAHRLQPANWTYKRQAWSFADPNQGPTDLYEGDWLSDVQKFGPENYYPALKM
jgi:hypothetical protein